MWMLCRYTMYYMDLFVYEKKANKDVCVCGGEALQVIFGTSNITEPGSCAHYCTNRIALDVMTCSSLNFLAG